MLSFENAQKLWDWLKRNHATEPELWVRIYKKASGTPSVDWEDCVINAIAWGWIDGQRKALDEVSFLQRLTPRRAGSSWSKRNTAHAERLIANGQMQPSGLSHVEAARRDGRWATAYSGSAEMVLPNDLLEALGKAPRAKEFFDTLDRRNQYAIYHRLQTAQRVETRKKRLEEIVTSLANGTPFH